MTQNAVSKLKRCLAGRSDPLLIRIDEDRCVVAAHFEFGSQYYFGITLRHSQGPIDIGVDPPKRNEYYGSMLAEFNEMSLDEKRDCLIEEFGLDEDLPDDHAGLNNWLSEDLSDYERENWEERVDPLLSEGTPGFLLLESLDSSEAKKLGLQVVDLGGPASSVPRVQFSGDPARLEVALAKKEIPLRLVFGMNHDT